MNAGRGMHRAMLTICAAPLPYPGPTTPYREEYGRVDVAVCHVRLRFHQLDQFRIARNGRSAEPIASAAGFVESLINEIFRAATNAPRVTTPNIAGILPDAVEKIKDLWNPPTTHGPKPGWLQHIWAKLRGHKPVRPPLSTERNPPLDKYQHALTAIGKSQAMPKGHQTCQRVQIVFDLRNALLQYTPE